VTEQTDIGQTMRNLQCKSFVQNLIEMLEVVFELVLGSYQAAGFDINRCW
jgi:hypothetical protein